MFSLRHILLKLKDINWKLPPQNIKFKFNERDIFSVF